MKTLRLKSKLIISVIGLCMLAGCQNSEQRAEEREKFGIELFKKGDYAKAKLELNSALKEDGTLATSYYYLALLNEKNKSYRAMKENLMRVVELNPKNTDARIKLGQVYLLFNDLDAALIQADELLTHDQENLEALTLKAAVLIKQKRQGDALAIIDSILQKHPQYVEAVALKAMLLMQNEQFDSALMLVNPAIDSGIGDISLHLLKIQLDAMQKNIAAVIADYERLSKLYPDNLKYKYALAKLYVQADRKQDAEDLLKNAVKSEPLKIQPKLVLLDYFNSFSKEKVVEQIKKYRVENKNKPEILYQISQWLLAMNYFSEAQEILENIDDLTSDTELQQQAKLLLARVAYHKKELKKSKTMVDELIAINSENQQAKILKAKINIALEQYDEAVQLLKKVLWVDPNSDESLVLLAQVELIKGDPAKADKRFREALAINPANMKALVPVINRSLRDKNIDYAAKLLTQAIKLQPNNLMLLKEAAEIKMATHDWDGAKKILNSLAQQPKGSLLAKFLKARAYQEQGDCSQAVTVYKDVLRQSSDYPDVLRQMGVCYELMQQRPVMISYMTKFLEDHPENIAAYLIMGQLLLLDKHLDKAITTYKLALEKNNKPPQVYAALAKVYSQQNDYKKAIDTYKLGLEKNPDNVRLSIYLADVYQKVNEYKNAAALYESLLTVDPRLEIAINNYSALLVDVLGDKQSLEKARKLVARFEHSENPFYLDSFAWIELKSGNVNDAVPLLEKVNNMADLAVFKYHLGVAYHEQGNNAGAVAQLRQAVDMGKQKGDFDEIKLAQQLLNELSIADN